MDPVTEYYRKAASTVIKNLKKRNMDGIYFETAMEAVKKISSMLKEGSSVSWGGSMTLQEIGITNVLKNGQFKVFDRGDAKTPQEAEDIYYKALGADYYFMSSNAITKDGVLVNIDGRGNRLAALIYGPKKIFVIAGMNKLVADEHAGLKRIRTIASPKNTQRLEKNTPCRKTGFCEDCLSPDSICSHTVITRRSMVKDRICVILIGESLGY